VNADDVVQESFAIAYRVLRETEVRSLRPWLYAVVRNRSLNDLASPHQLVELVPDEIADLEDPSAGADNRATLALVIDELHDMPAGQRSALIKHESKGSTTAGSHAIWRSRRPPRSSSSTGLGEGSGTRSAASCRAAWSTSPAVRRRSSPRDRWVGASWP
jgi:RNA polymerase sigma-70 factor (ECF subfamily)